MLGAQPRLVLRLEWLTELPDMTPFLQTSQYLPIKSTSLPKLERRYSTMRISVLQALFFKFFESVRIEDIWRKCLIRVPENRFVEAPHTALALP